jgi:hypothetical protein
MIEKFSIDMKQANLYALLWMILGLTFANTALQLEVPKGEITTLLGLCFVVAFVLLVWGITYNVLEHTSYVGGSA